jgi:hypothetical protein
MSKAAVCGPKSAPEKFEQLASWNKLLFNRFLHQAAECREQKRTEELMQWCSVAAWFASRKGWFGELSSSVLEAELLHAARSLPEPPRRTSSSNRPRWLHVLTEAYATLGHTNLCRRWIQYDPEVVHDVIITDQKIATPPNLAQAVKQTGGDCVVLDPGLSLLERARQLRSYAWQNSDVVVLHIHPEDVMATVAFGVPGGPPVLLVNHADHVFWVGCSIADLILDIRASGHAWTKEARGVERTEILPLPLAAGADSEADREAAREARARVRSQLGIREDEVMFLTVGNPRKYEPVGGLNFADTAVEILRRCKNARMIAVGPRDEGPWRAAKKATSGSFLAVGFQPDSTLFCKAADVYMEGFPAGSLTAVLEAGESGLACVRAPADVIPPFASDGAGMDVIPQPANCAEYVEQALALGQNKKSRTVHGQSLQQAIRACHCAEGWRARLGQIRSGMPRTHSVNPDFRSTPVARHRRDWLLEYLFRDNEALEPGALAEDVFVEAWRRTTGKAELDETLWNELSAQGSLPERDSLFRLNARIRRQGIRSRLIARAGLALSAGKRDVARKLAYTCLWNTSSSIADLEWIKLLLKSHLNPKWLKSMRRLKFGLA